MTFQGAVKETPLGKCIGYLFIFYFFLLFHFFDGFSADVTARCIAIDISI